MKETFGAAIEGAGWVSTQHVKAYMSNPHTKVVAICSLKESSAKKLADMYNLKDVKIYSDYDRMLDDPNIDIVSICTPQHLHADEVVKAAEAKKHIFIEKPVGIALEQLKAMGDAVKRNRVKTVVGVVARWNPIVQTIKNLLAKDFFGSIYYVEADYQSHITSWWSGWEWARKKDTGVSSFLVAGVHALDLARWFAETDRDKAARVVEVTSYSGGYRKNKQLPPFEFDMVRYTGKSGKGSIAPPMEYDGLEVMLTKFNNGAIGKVSSNYDVVMPYNFTWEVFGNKGTCKNNKIWSSELPGQSDWTTIPGVMLDTADVVHHAFTDIVATLVDCIVQDRDTHANLEDAINTHEAALAAIISQREGRPVKLPLIA
jgi:predicted dehydrogenase